jgi:DNA-binding LacI/PurR family transcriptional regulator
MQKKVSIKEIAALAGVSKATVSRVLNAKPGVSPATRKKVEEVIAAHAYAPNLVARGLSLRRTGIIGLVVAHTAVRLSSHLFFLEFLRGISRVLEKEGFRLILATADSEEDYESSCRNMAQEGLVDGVVVLGIRRNDKRLQHFLQRGLPLVTVGNPLGHPGVSFVDADNYGGARMATEYLIGLGHKEILFINGPKTHTGAIARERGYKAALASHGIEPHIVYGDFSFESGYKKTKEFIAGGRELPAVFAASDLAAMGAITALKEAGLRTGKDASVIGVDDIPYASFFDPPLTTVHQPIVEMGEETGGLIHEVMQGVAKPVGKIFPTTLVVRQTTPSP